MNENKVDVLNEPLIRVMIKLSWPVVTANLLQTIYNIVDAFWLGKLGAIELSAPTVSWPIIFTILSLTSGFSIAGIALVAQYTGSGKIKDAENAAGQTLLVSAVFGLLIGICGSIFSHSILSLLGVKGRVLVYANEYMITIFLGTPLLFAMMVVGGIFQGWGNTLIGMKFTLISVIINVVLDPLMIFGIGFPRLGVLGAALATVISRGIVSVYALYILFVGKIGFKIRLSSFKPNKRMIMRILKVGFPSSFGQGLTALGFVIIMSVITRFGPVVISAYGVGNRITSLITMFGMGVSRATATVVGQALGAERIKKAVQGLWTGFWFTFITVSTMCVFTFLFGGELTHFFISDPDVIEVGRTFFKLVSFSIPFFSSMQVLLAALQGSGHTFQSTFVNVTRLWGVRIPLVIWMAAVYGINGVFYAIIISNILALLLALVVISIGRWKKKII